MSNLKRVFVHIMQNFFKDVIILNAIFVFKICVLIFSNKIYKEYKDSFKETKKENGQKKTAAVIISQKRHSNMDNTEDKCEDINKKEPVWIKKRKKSSLIQRHN